MYIFVMMIHFEWYNGFYVHGEAAAMEKREKVPKNYSATDRWTKSSRYSSGEWQNIECPNNWTIASNIKNSQILIMQIIP